MINCVLNYFVIALNAAKMQKRWNLILFLIHRYILLFILDIPMYIYPDSLIKYSFISTKIISNTLLKFVVFELLMFVFQISNFKICIIKEYFQKFKYIKIFLQQKRNFKEHKFIFKIPMLKV